MFERTWSTPRRERPRRGARGAREPRAAAPRACSWSINYCTVAALLICVVIVALFVEEFLAVALRGLAGALFVAAMVALIGGLTCFLREVYLATHTTSVDLARFEE